MENLTKEQNNIIKWLMILLDAEKDLTIRDALISAKNAYENHIRYNVETKNIRRAELLCETQINHLEDGKQQAE